MLQGVLSGPYTGPKKLVDATRLPPAARQRLADVLTGRAEPTPILHEGRGGISSRFRATWGVLAAIIALATLTAIGFADPSAAWAYQPHELVAGYAAASMLLLFSLLSLHRRRALSSGNTLVPGRYLLPLDIVEVPVEDARGEQVIVVTPLGSARDVRVRTQGRRNDLVLIREGGAETVFTLRTEREGEHALRRLEHAQQLLEDLTYGRDLEKAVANDVFFDVRVDASWASLEPSGPVSGASRRRRSLLQGSLVTVATLAAGAALGWGAFVGRGWASDRGLFARALREGTPEALDGYLVRATSYREDALALKERLAEQRIELARRAAESRRRAPGFEGTPRAEWELTDEEKAARRDSSEACLVSLRARSSTAHPEAAAVIESILANARMRGDPVVPVRVTTRLGAVPRDLHEAGRDHAARVSAVITSFERIFSETCPQAVLKLVEQPASEVALAGPASPGLEIRMEVSWPSSSVFKMPDSVVHAPSYVFEVALRGRAVTDVATFRLTMAPPSEIPLGLRERSLFVIPPRRFQLGPDGGPEPHAVIAYRLLSARAFDRLYDELYALFFRGDPKVPLIAPPDEDDGLAPFRAPLPGPAQPR